MTPIVNWFKKIWFVRSNQDEEIDKLIADHKALTEKADRALSQMIAALDGETGWFECSCTERVKEKEKK